jgi:hypothetical protein
MRGHSASHHRRPKYTSPTAASAATIHQRYAPMKPDEQQDADELQANPPHRLSVRPASDARGSVAGAY